MQSADGGIPPGLGHGARAEAVALLRHFVAEHCELDRRLAQACEFQRRVKLRPLAPVGAESLPVGRLEIGAHRRTAGLVVDLDKARRLAVADRRRKGGEAEKLIERRLGHGSGPKAANVPPPGDKFGELGLEARIEHPRRHDVVSQIPHCFSGFWLSGIGARQVFRKGNVARRPRRN